MFIKLWRLNVRLVSVISIMPLFVFGLGGFEGFADDSGNAHPIRIDVEEHGESDNATALYYSDGEPYPERILSVTRSGDTELVVNPSDGRLSSDTSNWGDSTFVTEYNYDDNNYLVSALYKNYLKGELVNDEKNEYFYNEDGRLLRSTWMSDAQTITRENVFNYDEDGLLIGEETTNIATGNAISNKEYVYSDDGGVIATIEKAYDPNTGELKTVGITRVRVVDVPVFDVRFCDYYSSDALGMEPISTLYITLRDDYGNEIVDYSLEGNKIGLALDQEGYLVDAVNYDGHEITVQYEGKQYYPAQAYDVTYDAGFASEVEHIMNEILQSQASADSGDGQPTTPNVGGVLDTIPLPGVTETTGKETTEVSAPTEEPQTQYTATYVLNTNTFKFHIDGCRAIYKMSESNKAYYTGTREEIIAMGYSPCGWCNP